jgi:hypothetical protein
MRTSLISRQLGYHSLAVTSVYLDHVLPAQLGQAIDAVASTRQPCDGSALRALAYRRPGPLTGKSRTQ